MSKRPPTPRARIRRWATRIGAALGILWAIYLIAANAVGRSAWLQTKLNADPQASQITFDGFWTVIPGNFHLRNLKATFQYQTGTQVHVVGDRLEIDFSVFALLRKHIVATRLEIDGFVFQEREASMTIPGLPAIATTEPLDVTKAPPALWYDEAKSGWLIRIDDLEVTHARELWFYPFRYEGDAQLHGAISLRPNRELAFDAIRFDLGPGTGKLMGAPAMRDLTGSIEGTMAPIDPAQLRDIAVLRSLSVAVSIATDLENLEFMNDVAMTKAVLFGGTGGRIALDVKMVDGKIAAPGRARIDLESLWINVAGVAATSSIHADGVIANQADKPVIFLTADVDDAAVRDSTMRALASASGTRMFAAIRDVDFCHVEAIKLAWSVVAPGARIEDTQRMNPLLASSGIGFAGGSVAIDARAHGALPDGSLAAHFAATSDVVTVVAGDGTTWSATLKAGADIARANAEADLQLAHAFVYLDNGAVRHGQTANHAWWARVDVGAAHVRASDSALVLSRAHVQIRDLEPVFTSVQVLHGVPTWIERAAALSPWVIDVRGTFGKKIDISWFEAVAGQAGQEKARVRLTYDNTTKVEKMRAAIDLGVLSFGVEKKGDGVSVILSDVDAWFKKTPPTKSTASL